MAIKPSPLSNALGEFFFLSSRFAGDEISILTRDTCAGHSGPRNRAKKPQRNKPRRRSYREIFLLQTVLVKMYVRVLIPPSISSLKNGKIAHWRGVRIAAVVGTNLYIDGGSLSLALNASNPTMDVFENSLPPLDTQHARTPSLLGALTIGND